MNVPLLDLVAQYKKIKEEIDDAVASVFASQSFILGPMVTHLEKEVAAYSSCAHGCGVSSGTDALLIALMNEDIGTGDEVITTPYTFFATAGSIARTGAKPVFVDIDPETFNVRTDRLEAAITSKTRAIMVVHLYGLMADMDPVMAIAQKHNLIVIEDAAQAIGAEYKGRRAGSVGDYGCFSFFPSKNLGGAGDGGMVVLNDAVKAEKLATMRNHGMKPKYYNKFIGGNFRLDALQAAVVGVKLKYLDKWTEARQRNADLYDQYIEEAGLRQKGVMPPWRPRGGAGCSCRHIINQYVLRVPRRDALRDHLTKAGIGTEIYYPVPLHQQECFAYLGYKTGAFPESERAANETVAVPVYPELTKDQIAYVVESIASFYK